MKANKTKHLGVLYQTFIRLKTCRIISGNKKEPAAVQNMVKLILTNVYGGLASQKQLEALTVIGETTVMQSCAPLHRLLIQVQAGNTAGGKMLNCCYQFDESLHTVTTLNKTVLSLSL